MTKQIKNVRIIKLYAITICTIYQECLAKAGLLDTEGQPVDEWALQLYEKLKLVKEINILFQPREWRPDYHNYLRDKYNFALNILQYGNPKIRTGYEYTKILPLLMYSDKLNYQEFDQSFDFDDAGQSQKIEFLQIKKAIAAPIEIPVLYTPVAFGRTSIFRSPEKGQIHVYPNGDLVFEGETCLYIKHNDFKDVSLHAMYGDDKNWVKINYQKNGKIRLAYFAEAVSDGSMLQLLDPQNILDLLSRPLPQ